jgi:hypothetical protein
MNRPIPSAWLEPFRHRPEMGAADYEASFTPALPRRTALNRLNRLRDAGLIDRSGETRSTVYQLASAGRAKLEANPGTRPPGAEPQTPARLSLLAGISARNCADPSPNARPWATNARSWNPTSRTRPTTCPSPHAGSSWKSAARPGWRRNPPALASLIDQQANPAAIPLDGQGVHDPWISSFIPSTRTISKALPNWQVGLPFSKSTMNRKPLPEAMAKSFWVTFKRRRCCRIASPKVLASSIVLIPDRENSWRESWNPSKSS